MSIELNHIYRSKKPKRVRLFQGDFYDDRVVVFMSKHNVQYDSPTVRDGRKYPATYYEKFEAWAGEDVTIDYPENWAVFP